MSYEGHVYERETMRPLEGISVSNGRHIVQTDAEGFFSLPDWERAHVLFLNLLTRSHDDWFIYILAHKGAYDFYIDPVDTSAEEFSFLHTSDTEIDNPVHAKWLPFACETVERQKPLFFMHTGDLGRISVPRHYLYLNRETVGCPVRYGIGNHDYVGEDYGESTYERYYGPTWYAFDCGRIRFIMLSIGKGDRPSGYSYDDGWIWMEEHLKTLPEGYRVIVFQHDNCRYDERGFAPTICERVYDLRAKGLLAWVFGHFHNHYLHDYDGIYQICTSRPDSGGIDSSPGALREIRIRGTELSSELHWRVPPEGPCDPFLWQTQLKGEITCSAPLSLDGDVLIGTTSNGLPKQCGVFRVSGETGEVLWKFSTRDSVENELGITDQTVFCTDSQGWLYALDPKDGSLLWERYCPLSRASRTKSNVLVVGDTVVAGSHAHVYAFDRRDGRPLWDTFVGQCECTPARFVYDEKRNRLIVSAHWVGLGSLDLSTGALCWLQREHPIWFRSSTPLVIGDEIYSFGNRTAYVLSAETGEILRQVWLAVRADVSGVPLSVGEELYFPTVDCGVLAVRRETLERLRTYPTETTVCSTSPYVSGESQTVESDVRLLGEELFFAGLDGNLHFYGREDAELHRRIRVGRPITVTPLLMGERLVVADFFGRLTCFPLKEKE